METKKRTFNPQVETKLRRADFNRLDELAKKENKTKSEVLREAFLWYADHKEELENADHDAATVRAIDAMTNRVCAMLARQGRYVGTLFELTYSSMSGTPEGKEVFQAALTKSKQMMAKTMEKDERDAAESVRRTVKA